ncbi:hypothetical protein Hte_003780 [Hypoxylon texense]
MEAISEVSFSSSIIDFMSISLDMLRETREYQWLNVLKKIYGALYLLNDILLYNKIEEEVQDLVNYFTRIILKTRLVFRESPSPFHTAVVRAAFAIHIISDNSEALPQKGHRFQINVPSNDIEALTLRLSPIRSRYSALLSNPIYTEQSSNDVRLQQAYSGWVHAAVNSGSWALLRRLLDLGAEKCKTDAYGRIPLHIAAKTGRYNLASMLLDGDTGLGDIDAQDKDGKTPLYYAVAHDHFLIVQLLLQKEADPNIATSSGSTILSLVLHKDHCQDIAKELLEHGASPLTAIDTRLIELISAAASGDKPTILKLLGEGVNVNGQDGFGYNALYEAARFGHCEIVELLIDAGAKLDSTTGLSGETALHGIVDKGYKCRQLLEPFKPEFKERNNLPSLGLQHLEVVRVLLQYGLMSDAKRWDGLTANALISELSVDDEKEQEIINELEDLIENPPVVTRRVPLGKWNPLPPKLSAEKLSVCSYFKARVHYHNSEHFRPRLLTVDKYIYNREEKNIKRFDELKDWACAGDQAEGVKQYWRWIHLPANNKRWINDLIRVTYRDTDPSFSKIRALEGFIDETFQEYRGSAPYARYRKPSFNKKENGSFSISSLVIPYFDMETEEFLSRYEERKDEHVLKMNQLEHAYRHEGSPTDLHLACTLDQSYYTSLSDSSDRDRDQVVFRFFSRNGEPTEQANKPGSYGEVNERAKEPQPTKKGLSKLLMVSQLWLWKIDEDTIITALPERWHKDQEGDILSHILRSIYDSPPSSLDQMIQNILNGCIGFVDAPSNAGLGENLFDIFEQSIAKVANDETLQYKTFYKHQDKCAEMYLKIRQGERVPQAQLNSLRNAEDKICDITEEIKHLQEIKDIRDELKMIQRVMEDQETVLKKFLGPEGDRFNLDVLPNLEFRRKKAERLSSEAESVENSLKSLLDLKQKQGNLNEARDTRKLADEAEKRALAGETQSRLLFVFTIITVIYTPLGFTSAFFAIPSSDFPRESDGDDISWRWWHIFLGSVIAEILTLVVVFAYWWRESPSRSEPPSKQAASQKIPAPQQDITAALQGAPAARKEIATAPKGESAALLQVVAVE